MSLPAPTAKPAASKPAAAPSPWWRQPYRLTAVIAGLFLLAVGLTMLARHARAKTEDPLHAPQLAALKEQLKASPQDEQLKQKIRALDLQLRRSYFYQISSTNTGSWLLLGGLGALLAAWKMGAGKRRNLLPPRPSKEEAARRELLAARRMRWSVAGMGSLAGVAFVALGWNSGTLLPARLSDLEKPAAAPAAGATAPAPKAAADFATWAAMQAEWPRFRGADGGGFSTTSNAPLTWDAKAGAGVLWKSAVTAPGHNSPVVWGERVFLAGGDKNKRVVFCYHAVKGDLLWERPLDLPPPPGIQEWEFPEMAGMAAATMATDGRRAYAIFANGDLAAFDFEGKKVWAKNLGLPHNQYGHSASLALWQDRLIVLMDQGEKDEGKGRLYAIDGATGKTVWEKTRPVGGSWDSPIVAEAAGKPQIITLSVPWVIAYSATDGAELWRVEGLTGEVTPSPIFAAGLFFAVSPSDKLYAIKPDGQGDITKTHVAWTTDENVPDITSPVSNGELVFTATTGGILACFDLKDGKKLWEHDFELEFQASPSIAGNRLYLLTVKGKGVVVEAGREFKELARSDLGEPVYASPAFARDRIYIRGATNLFCLGAK